MMTEQEQKFLKLSRKTFREQLKLIKEVFAEKGMDISNFDRNTNLLMTHLQRDFARKSGIYQKLSLSLEDFMDKHIEEIDFTKDCLDELKCRIFLRNNFDAIIKQALVNSLGGKND